MEGADVADASVDGSEEVDAEEDKEVDALEGVADDAPAAPPKPPMSKMIVQLATSTIASRSLKLFDPAHPKFLFWLRLFYYGAVSLRLASHALIRHKIRAARDLRLVKKRAAADPLSMMLGGMLGGGGEEPTVEEYDGEALKGMHNQYQIWAIVIFCMHLKFKWNQTLVYSATSALVELFYHPLFQIHLLGREATGPYGRPFGGDGPDLSKVLQQVMANKPSVNALAS